ncbi:MAG TPA: alpha-L-fucosidase, partial [Gemmatimonadales bacterium]|nr:alpha-L-fucosidase [Gemmatimonadales bacterium]
VPYPGADGPGIIDALQHGDPEGSVWRPGETDTSIRPGWFYHPAEDTLVRSPDDLVQLYCTSVGRNSKLLLNVPPTREGLLHPTDVANLLEMRRRLSELFADDLTAGRHPEWRLIGARGGELTVGLGRHTRVGLVDLREEIAQGQLVARYVVEGHDGARWRTLSEGRTIGCRKIDRCAPVAVDRVRLRILDALAAPRPVRLGLHAG